MMTKRAFTTTTNTKNMKINTFGKKTHANTILTRSNKKRIKSRASTRDNSIEKNTSGTKKLTTCCVDFSEDSTQSNLSTTDKKVIRSFGASKLDKKGLNKGSINGRKFNEKRVEGSRKFVDKSLSPSTDDSDDNGSSQGSRQQAKGEFVSKYKTEMCKNWELYKTCKWNDKVRKSIKFKN